jgi:hypothetical protein
MNHFPARLLFTEWARDLGASDPESIADQVLVKYGSVKADEETAGPLIAYLRELATAH